MEEYEKVKEEKRKALLAMKSKERKVEFDEELQSMKQLLVKKENDEVFIKLVCVVYYNFLKQIYAYFITSLMVVDAMSICRVLLRS